MEMQRNSYTLWKRHTRDKIKLVIQNLIFCTKTSSSLFAHVISSPCPCLDVLVPDVQFDGFAQDEALFGWFHPEGHHAHVLLVHDDVIRAIQEPVVGLGPGPQPFVLGVAFHFPHPGHFALPETLLRVWFPNFDGRPEGHDLPGDFDGAPDVEPQLLGVFLAPVEPGVVGLQFAPIFHQPQRARHVDFEVVVFGEHVERTAEWFAGPHLAKQDVAEQFRLESCREQGAVEFEVDHRLAAFVFPFGEAFDLPLFAVDVQIDQDGHFCNRSTFAGNGSAKAVKATKNGTKSESMILRF